MNKLKKCLILSIAIIAILSSCEKDNDTDTPKQVNSKILQIGASHFYYDIDDNITAIAFGSIKTWDSIQFTYKNGVIISAKQYFFNEQNNYQLYDVQDLIFTRDSLKRVTKIEYPYNSINYAYNNSDQIESISTIPNDTIFSPNIEYIYYENSNVTRSVGDTWEELYSNYNTYINPLNLINQKLNYPYFGVFGMSSFLPGNKKSISAETEIDYSYEYILDEQNRVINCSGTNVVYE